MDVMKLEKHAQIFCSPLQFTFCYITMAFEKRDKQIRNGEDTEQVTSES